MTFSAIDGCFAIVENIPAIVLDIETTLRNYGAQHFLIISTALQSEELLAHPSVAAAIIDSRFAGPLGQNLARKLRERKVPVVFLNADSAFAPDGALSHVPVIAKPHGERELVDALRIALELHLSPPSR